MHPCRFHTLTHSFPFSNIFPIYISQEILVEIEALDASFHSSYPSQGSISPAYKADMRICAEETLKRGVVGNRLSLFSPNGITFR